MESAFVTGVLVPAVGIWVAKAGGFLHFACMYVCASRGVTDARSHKNGFGTTFFFLFGETVVLCTLGNAWNLTILLEPFQMLGLHWLWLPVLEGPW